MTTKYRYLLLLLLCFFTAIFFTFGDAPPDPGGGPGGGDGPVGGGSSIGSGIVLLLSLGFTKGIMKLKACLKKDFINNS
jgi:hypothetical protein